MLGGRQGWANSDEATQSEEGESHTGDDASWEFMVPKPRVGLNKCQLNECLHIKMVESSACQLPWPS